MTLKELNDVSLENLYIKVNGRWKKVTLDILDVFGAEEVNSFLYDRDLRDAILVELVKERIYNNE